MVAIFIWYSVDLIEFFLVNAYKLTKQKKRFCRWHLLILDISVIHNNNNIFFVSFHLFSSLFFICFSSCYYFHSILACNKQSTQCFFFVIGLLVFFFLVPHQMIAQSRMSERNKKKIRQNKHSKYTYIYTKYKIQIHNIYLATAFLWLFVNHNTI